MLPQLQTYEIEEACNDSEENYVFGDYEGWSLDGTTENNSSCDNDAYTPVNKTSYTHTQSAHSPCPCGSSMKEEDTLYHIVEEVERLRGNDESWCFTNNTNPSLNTTPESFSFNDSEGCTSSKTTFRMPIDPSCFMCSSAISLRRWLSLNAHHPYVAWYIATARDVLKPIKEKTPSTWHADQHERSLHKLDPFVTCPACNGTTNELNPAHVFTPNSSTHPYCVCHTPPPPPQSLSDEPTTSSTEVMLPILKNHPENVPSDNETCYGPPSYIVQTPMTPTKTIHPMEYDEIFSEWGVAPEPAIWGEEIEQTKEYVISKQSILHRPQAHLNTTNTPRQPIHQTNHPSPERTINLSQAVDQIFE